MKTLSQMVADVIPCPDAQLCEQATSCETCDAPVCPNHSPNVADLVECVDGGLHCDGCQVACRECAGAACEDDYEDRYERSLGGEF